MEEPQRQAIKIPGRAYHELKRLTAEAARYGWSAFGIDRTDTPTQTALIEEAIRLLGEQLKTTSKGKKR
jgi:hypothetical protein